MLAGHLGMRLVGRPSLTARAVRMLQSILRYRFDRQDIAAALDALSQRSSTKGERVETLANGGNSLASGSGISLPEAVSGGFVQQVRFSCCDADILL